jgi:hypothetical protein
MTYTNLFGFFKRAAGGASLVAAALSLVVIGGCSTYAGVDVGTVRLAQGELSRAQFVAQVSDYLGWYHASNYNDYWKVPLRTFTDVKATDPYGKQIENAYEENVIAPDASGKFHPQASMTRQDAAVILAKAFFVPLPPTTTALNAFSDAGAISEAAKPSVAALVAAGYLPGRSSTQFAPMSAITAAEAQAAFDAIAANSAVVVQAMPKQAASHLTVLPDGAGSPGAGGVVADATVKQLLADRNYSPRRFIQLSKKKQGATIY